MLDYILSKMVLLVFLLLLVAAFGVVKDALDSYFVQRAAGDLAKRLATDIESVVTAIRTNTETKTDPLPLGLKAGGRTVLYELNVIAYQSGGQCYVGILVIDPARERLIGYRRALLGEDVTIEVCSQGDSFYESGGTEQKYFVIYRVRDPTGHMDIKIAPSDDPNTIPSGLDCVEVSC